MWPHVTHSLLRWWEVCCHGPHRSFGPWVAAQTHLQHQKKLSEILRSEIDLLIIPCYKGLSYELDYKFICDKWGMSCKFGKDLCWKGGSNKSFVIWDSYFGKYVWKTHISLNTQCISVVSELNLSSLPTQFYHEDYGQSWRIGTKLYLWVFMDTLYRKWG